MSELKRQVGDGLKTETRKKENHFLSSALEYMDTKYFGFCFISENETNKTTRKTKKLK